jgi:hypothetical protein
MAERIKGDWALAEAYGRMAEHLSRNNVDLGSTPLTLGAPLSIDPAAGRFTGANADLANPLMACEYRSPFVVPELA